jgi:hypothetical protein
VLRKKHSSTKKLRLLSCLFGKKITLVECRLSHVHARDWDP